MMNVSRTIKLLCILCVSTFVFLTPQNASAIATDLLGDIAQPLIGPAKEKMKGVLLYIWLQPYAGYGQGSSEQSRTNSGGAVTTASDIGVDGFMYGGRGGILLYRSIRVGMDISVQSLKRNTLVDGTTVGTYVQQPVKGKNSMVGALVGFDVPYTPLQGFVTKYFKATVHGDSASDGEGWGGGFSFVIKNPFILSLETRKINYSSAVELTGRKAESTINQYYATISFMLL